MSEQLKPCPFCGWEAELIKFPLYEVRCSNCECEVSWFDAEQEAIAAWNARVECPDPFTCEYVLDAFERGREVGEKTERTCEGCKHKGSDPYRSPCYGCTHRNYDDCYEVES